MKAIRVRPRVPSCLSAIDLVLVNRTHSNAVAGRSLLSHLSSLLRKDQDGSIREEQITTVRSTSRLSHPDIGSDWRDHRHCPHSSVRCDANSNATRKYDISYYFVFITLAEFQIILQVIGRKRCCQQQEKSFHNVVSRVSSMESYYARLVDLLWLHSPGTLRYRSFTEWYLSFTLHHRTFYESITQFYDELLSTNK